tara:strand:- start:514 stop:1611 length:1098 start_codon:yes stop_codon:yes gene_type:complete
MALEDRPNSRRSNLIEPENTNKSPQKKGKSLVELLVGDSDLATLAQKFNLDPEMSDKIFIPLLSLLDKYGVGESFTSSPQLESATNTFEIIRDVAPIVKGAAEFISGRKSELESDDLAFLQAIQESQNDASLFDDEELFSVGEPVLDTPAQPTQPAQPAQPVIQFETFSDKDWGEFYATSTGADEEPTYINNELTKSMQTQQDALSNWAKEESVELRKKQEREQYGGLVALGDSDNFFDLGADLAAGLASTFAENNNTEFGIIDVTELAKEAGLSMSDIADGDSQRKINNEVTSDIVQHDYSINVEDFEDDFTPIDYTSFDVPDDAENYDPLHISGYDLPDMKIDPNEFKEFIDKLPLDNDKNGD